MKRLHGYKFLFSRMTGAGFAVLVLFFSAGCASHSDKYGIQPFGAVGTKADVYVFASVSGNEPLLKTVLTAFVPEKTAAQYLKRTSALYIGVEYGSAPSVTLASAGSYPVNMSGVLFSKKDGWEKRRFAGMKNIAYYHSQAADITLPSKHRAFALLGDKDRNTAVFLQRVSNPEQPVFPPRFQTLAETGGKGEIGLYARSGSAVAAQLFGMEDIELPVRSIELYLKNTGSSYHYSAVFEAVNARAASVLRMLLGAVLAGTFSIQETSVFVENADISEAELVELLRGISLLKGDTRKL